MQQCAHLGDWVQIHETVLRPEERTGKLPDETRMVPLEMWIKGFLQKDCELGGIAEVRTLTGRKVSGCLVAVDPGFEHGFGQHFVPETLGIGIQLRGILESEDRP